MPGDAARKYIMGDWGTTRLRLFLVDNGTVAETREGPGIGSLTTTTAEARFGTLTGLVAPWMNGARPLEVLLSGMAGSRNGLGEVPYAPLPADCMAWSRAARTMRTPDLHITLAAGVRSDEASGADVMRGEETQIFGAMQVDPSLGRAAHVVLLPGTHSKWVEIADGSITHFRTAMTGELYALLHDRSTLLKTDIAEANDVPAANIDPGEGFAAGAKRSLTMNGGLLAALFETRAAQLLENRSKSWAAGFLSGLLIGYEILCMRKLFHTSLVIHLIGDPTLVSHYRNVFSSRGNETRALDGTECAIAGLDCLRKHLREH